MVAVKYVVIYPMRQQKTGRADYPLQDQLKPMKHRHHRCEVRVVYNDVMRKSDELHGNLMQSHDEGLEFGLSIIWHDNGWKYFVKEPRVCHVVWRCCHDGDEGSSNGRAFLMAAFEKTVYQLLVYGQLCQSQSNAAASA